HLWTALHPRRQEPARSRRGLGQDVGVPQGDRRDRRVLPTGTAITLKEFAEGTRWIIAGIMEWDMKPRAEGTIPPDSKIFVLPNTSFVIDGHFWAIPKGVSAAEQEIVLDLMKFMRRPDQQVLTWKAFIGPSIKA